MTVCLSFEPAKSSSESMDNSATESYLFWHSAEARKTIETGQTTCAKHESDVLLEITDEQRFSKLKGDIFRANDINHFDQRDSFREDLGNALCESYGPDGIIPLEATQ
ncbi:hypothetical protein Y032_0038g3552 [Ancylostoma ceylanicum]|uniref:Uncharacterized protein n=1 Tax=Ancylostoma ceylanicum TaxID=53326 RepID=A0A016UIG3_9BILA|nr:hypothetical protein Y032_0038g3552 [Ancylostoma ceylanicum]